MLSMLNEFYNFIAKKIDAYFQTTYAEGKLLIGETFCLKLDTEDMVSNVSDALHEIATSKGICGSFTLQCENGETYQTYTLKLGNSEIIIAPQINGMTSDFLCATLRNEANSAQMPILMISANPIDSAISGSKNMASNGMPFYGDELMKEIRDMVNDSTQLTDVEKSILSYELKRRDTDVFSDKASLYEYRDLLAIMTAGKIQRESFNGFRLFYIDGKKEYTNEGASAVDKKIKENNKLFDKIDVCFRFGNVSSELPKYFDDSFITRMENAQRKDPENWSTEFTYSEIMAQIQKHQAKIDNPLRIETEDISIYGALPFNSLEYGTEWLIRNEGSQTAKKRQKNIVIFNKDKFNELHIRFNCNARILQSDVLPDDLHYDKEGKDFIFTLVASGICFHKIEFHDSANDIKYIFKICMMDLSSAYMLSVIKHCYTIDYKKKKDIRIRLSGISNNLIFNENASTIKTEKLDDSELYYCTFDQCLHLHSTEEELSNYSSGLRIDIDFAGITVPFIMVPDEVKSKEITGKGILREKYATKHSLEFKADKIFSDTQEYFVKANLLRELRAEEKIINDNILVGKCKKDYITDQISITADELTQNEQLRQAYLEFVGIMKSLRTLPSLAYCKDTLRESAQKYVDSFMKLFSDLSEGSTLNEEQENALSVGTITVGNNDEIILTPLHPINVAYQLALCSEHGIEETTDVIIERLNSLNLLPYIKRKKSIFKVSDQQNSLEWKYYASVENKKYRGSWRFVPKLIEEKITEFISHFRYIFTDINNKTIKINLINMGDCSEVFIGIAQFFIHAINHNPNVEELTRFELHIYSENRLDNAFSNIREYSTLKQYLSDYKLEIASGVSMNTLEGIFSKNVECYFHEDRGKSYNYAHISFYEMESEITSEQAFMSDIETGISLNGILSGIPSSKYSTKYRTGYGSKYAPNVELIRLSNLYNSLIQVETTGNPYYKGLSISTQIDEKAESKMDEIYSASNWVVFVEPKVDLDFFCEKEANSDLLIIHYSDQYTTSSGYDAITVTRKSKQYAAVIHDYLKTRGVDTSTEDIHRIINLFNAVNGDWLLRLVSSKRSTKDSTFSREKISIVAAIKLLLAILRHDDIIWIPISLEEMLRVSCGAGLSQGDSILSAKNLGFEKGPTSDDLLFVGVDKSGQTPKIYLYPTEVKTGINNNDVIKKAFAQVSATSNGLQNAFGAGDIKKIVSKVNRNFLMQLIVTSCKKMKSYHVDDSQNWDIVLDELREALLNENYRLSSNIQEVLGKGAVLSFRTGVVGRRTSFKDDIINFIEVPETDEYGLILKSVDEIAQEIRSEKNSELMTLDNVSLEKLTGDTIRLIATDLSDNTDNQATAENSEQTDNSTNNTKSYAADVENTESTSDIKESAPSVDIEPGMKIMFGTNEQNGEPVIWKPNDTTQLFHTNTGIIGTMGTGKTQFTKSLITQLYQNQADNVDSKELGILIFDYKGDYNESKPDFVEATNAKIYKPYHLPFNPFALTKSAVFKPLLPTHTANAFKDTLSKVYNLGPKQQATLLQCIMEAYSAAGISPGNPATWDNEAPTFYQVYQRYVNDDDIKKGDSLAAALDKLSMFEIFEADPSETKSLFEMLQGAVVIDMSGYDPDIQSLIVAITLDLFYSQMQASGSSKMDGQYRQLTKMILVDEADNFMSEGFPSLKKILKEGREFGVGTILSTQFLKHFGSGDDDYSKYILTWIVHNVSDLKNGDVDFVFHTEPKSNESNMLFNRIKGLEKHHSLIAIGTGSPIYLHDKAFWQLYNELKSKS